MAPGKSPDVGFVGRATHSPGRGHLLDSHFSDSGPPYEDTLGQVVSSNCFLVSSAVLLTFTTSSRASPPLYTCTAEFTSPPSASTPPSSVTDDYTPRRLDDAVASTTSVPSSYPVPHGTSDTPGLENYLLVSSPAPAAGYPFIRYLTDMQRHEWFAVGIPTEYRTQPGVSHSSFTRSQAPSPSTACFKAAGDRGSDLSSRTLSESSEPQLIQPSYPQQAETQAQVPNGGMYSHEAVTLPHYSDDFVSNAEPRQPLTGGENHSSSGMLPLAHAELTDYEQMQGDTKLWYVCDGPPAL